MQQRLAVASVLVLALLAGASAVLIVHNAYGQNANAQTPPQSRHDSSSASSTSSTSTANTNSTSTGGSLLTTGNNSTFGGDDGNETEHEIETETTTGINSTLDN